MASQIAFLPRSHSLLKTLAIRTIFASRFSAQVSEQVVASEPCSTPVPLPPNPATGSPLYQENWRNPTPFPSSFGSQAVVAPYGFDSMVGSRDYAIAQTLDEVSVKKLFVEWTTKQKWEEMQKVFEFWTRALDKNGKPNKPDVDLYNHYLRANLMRKASAGDLLDLGAQVEGYGLKPNTASYNLVLKAMHRDGEVVAAQKLLQRFVTWFLMCVSFSVK